MPNLSDNIPESHITLPPLTVLQSPLNPKTKDTGKQQRTKEAAISRLKQKNRKHHTMSMTTLLDLTIEAGNNYKMSGFSPDIDDGLWTVVEATHSVTGKAASTTKIKFQRPPEVQ